MAKADRRARIMYRAWLPGIETEEQGGEYAGLDVSRTAEVHARYRYGLTAATVGGSIIVHVRDPSRPAAIYAVSVEISMVPEFRAALPIALVKIDRAFPEQ